MSHDSPNQRKPRQHQEPQLQLQQHSEQTPPSEPQPETILPTAQPETMWADTREASWFPISQELQRPSPTRHLDNSKLQIKHSSFASKLVYDA